MHDFYDYYASKSDPTGDKSYTANWTKETPTGIDPTNLESKIINQKLLRDGQLLIIRPDGTIYNAQGQIVK